jgi:hypothetical protein
MEKIEQSDDDGIASAKHGTHSQEGHANSADPRHGRAAVGRPGTTLVIIRSTRTVSLVMDAATGTGFEG